MKREKEGAVGKPGRDRLFSACSGSPGPPPPPGAQNVGTKPALPGWGQQPRGAAVDDSQVLRPPSPPASILPQAPSPRPTLTSGPPRQGERQQAQPDGAHTPGHGGSGPARAPRSQARGHASPPARRRRVWNPLLAQRLPARLPAIGSDAPPSAPQGSAAGWRRGRARLEGGGRHRRERARGTRGSRVVSGDGEQRREGRSPRRGRLHGGRGLGRVGGSGF